MHTFTSASRRSITAALVAVFVLAFATPAYASSSYHDDDYRYGNHYNSNSDWRYDDRDYDRDRTPSCELTAHPNTTGYGGSVRLIWESDYADYVDITDIGRVEADGERVINVYDSKTYYMTAYNDGRISTCSTLVNIPGDGYRGGYPYYYQSTYYNYNQYPYQYNYTTGAYSYTYPTTYTYPNQYLALSQIPYTGVDFGFAGTLLAWLSVIITAAAGAGFIAYRFGFAQRALALLRR